jgi:hypothetical protein
VRPTEVHALAQCLAVADGDVCAVGSWRLQQAERDGIHDGHEQRPCLVGDLGGLRHVLQTAEEVRLRQDDGAGLIVHDSPQGGHGRDATGTVHLDRCGAARRCRTAGRLGDEHLPVLRVHAA